MATQLFHFYFSLSCNKILPLLLLLFFSVSRAQNAHEQIEIKIENDKFVLKDKYYTNGLFLSYKKDLKANFLFNKSPENKLQLNIILGNETYTPENLSSTNVNTFDRPFAGWLFGAMEIGKIKETSAFFVTIEMGITGKESQSGNLQTWFHDFLGIDSSPTWVEEIAFKWLFNTKATYFYNWQINKSNALLYRVTPALGTKDIFIENNIQYFFGKFNALKNTSRIGAINTINSNEFFGYLSLGYKYVIHNTLIEGSLFKDETLFTTTIKNNVFKIELGSVLNVNKNTFKLVYSFNSKEATLSTYHDYGSFSYARRF